MASKSPDNTSNDLLIYNSSDMAPINAQNASNSLQNDLDLHQEIPMNLLPAGNSEIFSEKLF
jgi:hypothetical protein